jgi:hypothetical protein
MLGLLRQFYPGSGSRSYASSWLSSLRWCLSVFHGVHRSGQWAESSPPPDRSCNVLKPSFGFRLRAAERSLAASRPSPQSRPAFVGRDGAPASVPGWFFKARRLPSPFPFPCLLPSGGPAAPSPFLPAPSVTLSAGGARGGRAGPCFVRWGRSSRTAYYIPLQLEFFLFPLYSLLSLIRLL